jgi:hypothetical protein
MPVSRHARSPLAAERSRSERSQAVQRGPSLEAGTEGALAPGGDAAQRLRERLRWHELERSRSTLEVELAVYPNSGARGPLAGRSEYDDFWGLGVAGGDSPARAMRASRRRCGDACVACWETRRTDLRWRRGGRIGKSSMLSARRGAARGDRPSRGRCLRYMKQDESERAKRHNCKQREPNDTARARALQAGTGLARGAPTCDGGLAGDAVVLPVHFVDLAGGSAPQAHGCAPKLVT